MSAEPLRIVFQDEHYVAVDKPSGLLVHRSYIARDAREFLLQTLRNQLGRYVYPVHRLDRPTSGLILFGLSSDAARLMVDQFTRREVEKRYLAVLRGYSETDGRVDYALSEGDDKEPQAAITDYRRLATADVAVPVSRYPSARLSLVEAHPLTGRTHQIRQHFRHLRHPVIGDVRHGDRHHNKLFREHFDCHRLLLMSLGLDFRHPYSGEKIRLFCPPPDDVAGIFERLGWSPELYTPSYLLPE